MQFPGHFLVLAIRHGLVRIHVIQQGLPLVETFQLTLVCLVTAVIEALPQSVHVSHEMKVLEVRFPVQAFGARS